MRSNKQTQASKTNGRKSSGPVTDAGKANSARNAVTHNLSAAGLVLLSTEDQHEFHIHQAGHLNRFQPLDTVELDLVHKMICASWRERRVATMEAALFELQMERQREDVDDEFEAIAPAGRQVLALFGTNDASAVAGLLLRYGAAAGRAYATAFRLLRELQGDRFNNIGNQLPATQTKYLPPETSTETEAPRAATAPEVDSQTPAAPAASHVTALPRLRPTHARYSNHTMRHQLQPSSRCGDEQTTELPNEPKTPTTTGGAIHAVAA